MSSTNPLHEAAYEAVNASPVEVEVEDDIEEQSSAVEPPTANAVVVEDEDEDDSTIEVRVLEAKSSKSKTVRVAAGDTVASLNLIVEREFGVPCALQRLIASGRQMQPADLLSSHRLSTVHLVQRSSVPVAQPAEPEAAPPTGNMDFMFSLAPPPPINDGFAPLLLAQSAARVRMFSTLLTFYAVFNCLGAVVDMTAPPPADMPPISEQRSLLELLINLGGVWVGLAGLKASRSLDLALAERYDRALRVFAVLALGFEAFIALADVNIASRKKGGDSSSRGNATRIPMDDDDDDDNLRERTREAAILSGFITLLIWSAIWMTCCQYSSQLRAQLRDQLPSPPPPTPPPVAAPPAASEPVAFPLHDV